ncbi:MAG: DUF3422 domain-containing protein [Burkholderiaceae bacterium]
MSATIRLPAEHPLRRRLADEVHARPPVAVEPPAAISCIALLRGADERDDLAPLRALLARHGRTLETPQNPHVVVELDALRVKWERHSEFTSYTLLRPLGAQGDDAPPALATAFDAVAADWLAALPGLTIEATDVTFLRAGSREPSIEAIARLFSGPTLVGSQVSDAGACVFTDFQLTPDGRGRWLVLDRKLTRGQRARVVQRLIEIGVYRVMAVLAFPLAREMSAALTVAEQRLSTIAARIAELGAHATATAEVEREQRTLLDDLTQLAAEMEKAVAESAFRFSASKAYWDIVTKRVAELREERIGGIPTIGEFLSRRLEPAINTVLAAARRQQELSARIARASELLRTRVDIAREEQNSQLLAAMERRGKLSLRLQQTVEGLSVAAITYYAVGLVGYAVKPLKSVWPALNPDWITAAAIPVLAWLVWRGVRKIRKELATD